MLSSEDGVVRVEKSWCLGMKQLLCVFEPVCVTGETFQIGTVA